MADGHPSDTKSDWGKSLALTVSQNITSRFTCSSWTSRNCSIITQRARRSFERSARNGSTCPSSSTRRISRCHSAIRSGCEATYCQCSGKKLCGARGFLTGNKPISAGIQRTLLNESNNRSMEARQTSTLFTYRTQSSCTALGRGYATTKSRIRWTTPEPDRIGFRKHRTVEGCSKNLELLTWWTRN